MTAKDFPYFADCQPKKRELYETVTETGEMLSRSLEQVNVRKGSSTTDSKEVLDIFGGFNASGGYGGASASFGMTGQWGTRNMHQEEVSNVRSVDDAREKRETFSHSTNLTQMYHQLDSYHLGTNRAVFFVLPRPHVVQTNQPFVNGTRAIEGIQVFFLVVMRPAAMEEFCVDAYLETGHLNLQAEIVPPETQIEYFEHNFVSKAKNMDKNNDKNNYDGHETTTATFEAPLGWVIDTSNGTGGYGAEGGFDILNLEEKYLNEMQIEVSSGKINLWADVGWKFREVNITNDNRYYDGKLNLSLKVYLIQENEPETKAALFLTGRGLCCCVKEESEAETQPADVSVTWETVLDLRDKYGPAGMRVEAANAIVGTLAHKYRESLGHPDRQAQGTVGITESRFIGRQLCQSLDRSGAEKNWTVFDLEGLDTEILSRLRKLKINPDRKTLLCMSVADKMQKWGLTQAQALDLQKAATGLHDTIIPKPRTVVMPYLKGMNYSEAFQALSRIGLTIGDIEYLDSPQPTGIILRQTVKTGKKLPWGTAVGIGIATGLSVQIPQMEGQSLMDVICALSEAGLTSSPEIDYTSSTTLPVGSVVDIDPEPRTFVAPGHQVKITVAAKGRTGGNRRKNPS